MAAGLRGGRVRARGAGLARRSGHRRGGEGEPRGLCGQVRRPGRRLPGRADPRSDQEARRRRTLVRRAADPDHRGTRALSGLRRDRPGAIPRRPAASDLGAAVVVTRPDQPAQPDPRRPAHVRPVPVRVRERGRRVRGEGAVREVFGPRSGHADLRGGVRESQSVERPEGRHQEPRPRPVADPVRRARSHRALGDCARVLQEAAREPTA